MRSQQIQNADYIEDKGSYTDLMVLKSAAGWYVGTLYNDPMGFQCPGSRDTGYYASFGEAEKVLRDLTDGKLVTPRMCP